MTFVDFLHAGAIAAFSSLMVVAAVTDLRSLRIPNRLCLAVIVLFPAYALSGDPAGPWWSPLAVAAAVFFAGTIPFAFGHMGGGDVKLLAVAALWAGPAHVFELLAVSALAGGILALAFLTHLRFGIASALSSAGLAAEGHAVASGQLPYGIAIAAGGLAVAARLAGLW